MTNEDWKIHGQEMAKLEDYISEQYEKRIKELEEMLAEKGIHSPECAITNHEVDWPECTCRLNNLTKQQEGSES